MRDQAPSALCLRCATRPPARFACGVRSGPQRAFLAVCPAPFSCIPPDCAGVLRRRGVGAGACDGRAGGRERGCVDRPGGGPGEVCQRRCASVAHMTRTIAKLRIYPPANVPTTIAMLRICPPAPQK
eukprot:360256-Chlamydomonas_euryale.AAC.3